MAPLLQINDDLLVQLGLEALNDSQRAAVLRQFASALETRVGVRMASIMTPAQIRRMEQLLPDERTASEWLYQSVPGYRELVMDEFLVLVGAVGDAVAACTEQRGTDIRSDLASPSEPGVSKPHNPETNQQ